MGKPRGVGKLEWGGNGERMGREWGENEERMRRGEVSLQVTWDRIAPHKRRDSK